VLTRTTTQLLDSLRDASNHDLWTLFDDRYRPVLIAFARRRGLSEEDAADAAQSTLADFAADYRAGRYDRTRGRLRSWIIGIAQNRIAGIRRDLQRRGAPVGGDSVIGRLPDNSALERDWDEAVQRVALERAIRTLHTETRIDERTIRAFELSALRGAPAEVVATECGMTVAEVYVAKNRVIKKLRDIVRAFTQELDDV